MDRLFFIVNPTAGAGLAEQGFAKVCERLDSLGIDYGFERTRGAGHATELAKEALARGETRIISVGGDGTANEVAQAMAGSGAVMGLLPFGTGNDLAKALNLPTEPMAALDVLLLDKPRAMDAGLANGRLFLNVAGLGFDVDVLVNTDEYKKRFHGMLPYLMGIAKSLIGLQPLSLTLGDGQRTWREEATIISVGNGTHFGGGMNVLPFADPFDGLFDVSLVRRVSRLRFLQLLPLFIKGRHTDRPEVEYFRTKSLTVECSPEYRLNCDGEVGLSTPVTFTLLEGAISMLTGEFPEAHK